MRRTYASSGCRITVGLALCSDQYWCSFTSRYAPEIRRLLLHSFTNQRASEHGHRRSGVRRFWSRVLARSNFERRDALRLLDAAQVMRCKYVSAETRDHDYVERPRLQSAFRCIPMIHPRTDGLEKACGRSSRSIFIFSRTRSIGNWRGSCVDKWTIEALARTIKPACFFAFSPVIFLPRRSHRRLSPQPPTPPSPSPLLPSTSLHTMGGGAGGTGGGIETTSLLWAIVISAFAGALFFLFLFFFLAHRLPGFGGILFGLVFPSSSHACLGA